MIWQTLDNYENYLVIWCINYFEINYIINERLLYIGFVQSQSIFVCYIYRNISQTHPHTCILPPHLIIIIIKTISKAPSGKNEIVNKLLTQPHSTCTTENWKANSEKQPTIGFSRKPVMGNLGKQLNFPLVWTHKGAVESRRSNWYCAAKFTLRKREFCTIVSEHSM